MDAECFRPERWDEDLPLFRDRITQTYGYLPFNGVPRLCFGSESRPNPKAATPPYIQSLADIDGIVDFALTEAANTVVRIFQRYPTIASLREKRWSWSVLRSRL